MAAHRLPEDPHRRKARNQGCRTAAVSRAGYYRFIKPVAEKAAEMELRDAVQKQAVQMPAYGYRRITAALQRAGWEVNHKRSLPQTQQIIRTHQAQHSFVIHLPARSLQ